MTIIDYGAIGLKVGIEIHQQLDSEKKLFCNCPTQMSKDEPKIKILRRLRPSQSELGQIDPAALFEFQKNRNIIYETDPETSCLVELDEEPPHPPNNQAAKIGLQIALMLEALPLDEIHVMRKIVVDGSNTCGFQRSAILAIGGQVNVQEKLVSLQTICLEEDAARKISEDDTTVKYRLDRLGVPLVEITTAPEIYTPQEAEKVARTIGRILRATRKVKRGIGTIRQDLNVSIKGGALVEIKGVQKLDLISKIVESEAERQLNLLKIKDELRNRGITSETIQLNVADVTDVFADTDVKVIKNALSRGGIILAVKLEKFGGLVGRELTRNVRLGTEFSDRAKFWGRVGGIFHTDELPAYGITAANVQAIRLKLGLGPEDAAVIVADKKENAVDALKAVVERAREAVSFVPEETRVATPDGVTRYMRPHPGAARMYPETDVPPISVSMNDIDELEQRLPPLPDVFIAQLTKKYDLNRKLAEQLMDSEYLSLFEKIAATKKLPTTFIASALTETMKALERDGIPVGELTDKRIEGVFHLIEEGKMAKETFQDLIAFMVKNNCEAETALEKTGIKMLSSESLRTLIKAKISQNWELIRNQPNRAFEQIMKIVMSEARGKADAKQVVQIVKELLDMSRKNA